MPKKTRRKKRVPKQMGRAATTSAEQTLTRVIASIGFFFILTPFVFFSELSAAQSNPASRELLEWCIGINIFTVILRLAINAQVNQLKGPIFNDKAVHRKFRRYLVAIVALSIFSNLVLLIPIVYNRGYIDRSLAYLRVHGITNKFALGISFSLAAIVSGVIGNAAYDVLKHFLLKSFQKRET